MRREHRDASPAVLTSKAWTSADAGDAWAMLCLCCLLPLYLVICWHWPDFAKVTCGICAGWYGAGVWAGLGQGK